MFNFSTLQSGQQLWLVLLLAAWAVVLFGGFIFGQESQTHRIPTRNRMAASGLLVLAGWSWVLMTQEADIQPFAIAIALGMTLGFGGDLALSGWFGRSIITGMLLFGFGHVSYIVGIVGLSQRFGFATGWVALGIWLLIGLVGWFIVVFRGQKPTLLTWAALPYALLLATTTGVATGLALQSGQFWGLALGAALFLFSDLVLAGELFAGYSFKSVGDVIWLTYSPGQMLIVFAIGAAHLL